MVDFMEKFQYKRQISGNLKNRKKWENMKLQP